MERSNLKPVKTDCPKDHSYEYVAKEEPPKMLPSPRSSEEHHSQPGEGFTSKVGERQDVSEVPGGEDVGEKRVTVTHTGSDTGVLPPTESSSITVIDEKSQETATATATGQSKTVSSTATF